MSFGTRLKAALEKVTVRSRRRTWTTVSDLSEVIVALKTARFKILSRRQVLNHSDILGRQIVNDPMHPGA